MKYMIEVIQEDIDKAIVSSKELNFAIYRDCPVNRAVCRTLNRTDLTTGSGGELHTKDCKFRVILPDSAKKVVALCSLEWPTVKPFSFELEVPDVV